MIDVAENTAVISVVYVDVRHWMLLFATDRTAETPYTMRPITSRKLLPRDARNGLEPDAVGSVESLRPSIEYHSTGAAELFSEITVSIAADIPVENIIRPFATSRG